MAAAVVAAATGRAPDRLGVNQRDADAKTLVAWWAAALTRRLSDELAVLVGSQWVTVQTIVVNGSILTRRPRRAEATARAGAAQPRMALTGA